jgi:hypothetical protein
MFSDMPPTFRSLVSRIVHHLNQKCDGWAYFASGRENAGGLFARMRYLWRGSIAWLEMRTSKRPTQQIKEQYMKRLILAAGLFAATLTASLHAQTMDMNTNIPFN